MRVSYLVIYIAIYYQIFVAGKLAVNNLFIHNK